MNESEIISLSVELYPNCTGILLAGSQLKNERIVKTSDIDVVVISPGFSVVSSKIVRFKMFQIDFTQIPLFACDNILYNEQYDLKGTLLSMLSNGKILKDTPDGLTLMIKQKAQGLYRKKNHSLNNFNSAAFHHLKKIRKDFDRPLKKHERFFLLNEFIQMITQAELTRHSNWLHIGKHKSNFLMERSERFVNDLIELSEQNTGDTLKHISTYLDLYLIDQFIKMGDDAEEDRCILDIRYPKISIDDFILNVLEKILEMPLLNENFLFFFKSPKLSHKVYLNTISIVFTLPDGVNKNQIFLAFRQKFNDSLKKSVGISMIPGCIYQGYNPNIKINYGFEPVSIAVSKLCINKVRTDQKFDEERFFLIAIISAIFIIKHLDIELQDATRTNFFIAEAYCFDIAEQNKVSGYTELMQLRNSKYEIFNLYHLHHQDFLSDIIKAGLAYNPSDINRKPKEYDDILVNLAYFLEIQTQDYDLILKENQITFNLLKNVCKVTECQKALLYKLTFENLIRLLNIDANQVSLCLFVISESLRMLSKNIQLQKES